MMVVVVVMLSNCNPKIRKCDGSYGDSSTRAIISQAGKVRFHVERSIENKRMQLEDLGICSCIFPLTLAWLFLDFFYIYCENKL